MSFPPAKSYLLSFLKLLGKREKNNLAYPVGNTNFIWNFYNFHLPHILYTFNLYTLEVWYVRNAILCSIDKKAFIYFI